MSMETDFLNYRKMIDEALATVDISSLEEMKNEMLKMAKNRYPLLVCGNGGSAAISEHLSCDHTKGICIDTNLSPFVVPLSSNVSLCTAIANDIGYHEIFAKQIQWYHDPFARVMIISSSGNSPNILRALQAAEKRKMRTMALVGFDGGAAKEISDIVVHVNSNNYGVIEDCHQIIMHSIAQHIRAAYAKTPDALRL